MQMKIAVIVVVAIVSLGALDSAAATDVVRETAAIVPPEELDGGGFGYALGADDDWIVVGAWVFSPEWVAVYDARTLEFSHLIESPSENDMVNFGFSVDVHDGRAIVGANWDGSADFGEGAAYVFDIASGELLREFRPADGSFFPG
ncbi:MAG: hypothetical protein AAF432_03945 [Planctomycetota bacterium]